MQSMSEEQLKVIIDVEKNLTGLNDFVKEMNRAEKEIKVVDRVLKSLSRTFRLLGTIATGSLRLLKKSFISLKNAVVSLANKAKLAFTIIVATTSLLGVSALNAASEAEEAGSKFEAVFGNVSDQVRKTVSVVKNDLGGSFYDIQKDFGNVGALFKGLGNSVEVSARETEKVIRLAYDLASFHNLSIQEAIHAVRSGILGETESLKGKTGIIISENSMKEYSEALGVVWGDISQAEKAQLRLNYAFDQAQKQGAIGDMSRTFYSYANQLRSAQGKIKDLKTEMGEKLLPIATKLLVAFNKFDFDKIFNKQLMEAVKSVGMFTIKIVGMIGVIALLAKAFFLLLTPMGAVTTAFALFAGAWYLDLFGIRDKTEQVFNKIKEIFESVTNSKVFKELKEDFQALWKGITTGDWSDLQAELLDDFQQIGQFMSDQFEKLGSKIGWFENGSWDVGRIVVDMFLVLGTITGLTILVSAIAAKIALAVTAFTAATPILLNFAVAAGTILGAGAIGTGIGEAIYRGITGASHDEWWEDYKAGFKALFTKEGWSFIGESLKGIAKEVWATLKSDFKEFGGGFVQVFNEVKVEAKNIFEDLFNEKYWENLWGKAKIAFKETMSNLGEGIFDGIVSSLNLVIRGINKVLPKSAELDEINLDGFATGGYTGNGGKYEPAGIVHKGEYVIPAWMVKDNKELIANLERQRKGYSSGGLVGYSNGGYVEENMSILSSAGLADNELLKYLAEISKNTENFKHVVNLVTGINDLKAEYEQVKAELENIKVEADQIVNQSKENAEKIINQSKENTKEISAAVNSMTSLFSNLSTLTGNELFDKIGSAIDLGFNAFQSASSIDFSQGFSLANMSAGMNVAGAAIGAYSTLDSYFSSRQEEKNAEELEKYNENTNALQELNQSLQNLNANLFQFDLNNIRSLSANPTQSNIDNYSQNYQAFIDAIEANKDFGDVSMLSSWKYKNLLGKTKWKRKEYTLDEELLSALSGYDLGGRALEDLNLDELKEYRKALDNIDEEMLNQLAKGKPDEMNGEQWFNSILAGGLVSELSGQMFGAIFGEEFASMIGGLFGGLGIGKAKWSNQKNDLDEYKKNIDEYIEGIERLQEAQENLAHNAILESFEGINVADQKELIEQYTQQLEDTYMTFYNTDDIEEYREEIDQTAKEMAENAQVMVTAMNDVRSATISAMKDGKSEMEAFATGMSNYVSMIESNVAQMLYNINFGTVDALGNEAFGSFSDQLAQVTNTDDLNNLLNLDQDTVVQGVATSSTGIIGTGLAISQDPANAEQYQEDMDNYVADFEMYTAQSDMLAFFDSIAQAEQAYEDFEYTIQTGDWAGNVVTGSQAAIEALKDAAREAGVSEEVIDQMFPENEWETAAREAMEAAANVIEAGFGEFDDFKVSIDTNVTNAIKDEYKNSAEYKKLQEQIKDITQAYLDGEITLEEYQQAVEDAYNDETLTDYRDRIEEVNEAIEEQSEALEKAKDATIAAYEAYAESGDFRDFTKSFGESLYENGITALQELFKDTALMEAFAETLFDAEAVKEEIEKIKNSDMTDLEKQQAYAELYSQTEQDIKDNIRGYGYDFTSQDLATNELDQSSEPAQPYVAGADGSGGTTNNYYITLNAEAVYDDSADHLIERMCEKIEEVKESEL